LKWVLLKEIAKGLPKGYLFYNILFLWEFIENRYHRQR
jgi:hypothetical protein